ncbi:MAG: hypothetical protein UU56_C0019G0009 [Candidatus Curtissbacteria bacterium GW2011_GWA2_41_24]|nr:MAG: hypothetical protein UU56_C0019G0009 [Candidatus Curtissbacteria bacterium GW2011_GWA2_41_24]
MILATFSAKGPWVATLVFGHDANFNLYWISFDNTRHTVELEKNPQVAAAINKQPTGGGQDKGLQIEGKAMRLPEEQILGAAREYFAKRGTPHMPKTLEEVNTLTEGRSWFVLKPTKIYIYYGPLFGYERKEFVP